MRNNILSATTQRARATGLRQCLDDRGIKYSFVARKLGIWPAAMTAVLQGTRTLRKEQAEFVCELIGVPFFSAFVIDDGVESMP